MPTYLYAPLLSGQYDIPAIYCEVDGVYTGELVGDILHGPAKAEAVRALAAREGLELAQCAAYSDSINDLPLLESVGYPHAVNPESELRRIALTRGWPVHELRTRRKAGLQTDPLAIVAVRILGLAAALAVVGEHGPDRLAHDGRRRHALQPPSGEAPLRTGVDLLD